MAEKKKTGRPLKPIDKELVIKLAKIGCPYSEIAAVIGCSKETLHRRFQTVIAEAHEHGKSSLRHAMWTAALGGNVSQQIFLSKNVLGYSDKAEVKQQSHQIVIMQDDTPTNGNNGGPHNPEPDAVPAEGSGLGAADKPSV